MSLAAEFPAPEEASSYNSVVREHYRLENQMNTVRTLALVLLLANTTYAITIPMVTIGSPGNAPDLRFPHPKNYPHPGFGAVPYTYQISEHKITDEQLAEVMGGGQADYISYNQAELFVAKLNELTGLRYAIPTENEWYKAAYYDPATGTYNDIPWWGVSNLNEWNSTIIEGNGPGIRCCEADFGNYSSPTSNEGGFRVVLLRPIAEPSSLLLFCLGVLGLALSTPRLATRRG